MAEKVESIIYMIFFYSKEASKGQNNDPTVAREQNWTNCISTKVEYLTLGITKFMFIFKYVDKLCF